jgi:aspartokinase
MQDLHLEIIDPIRIDGIKVSAGLVLFNLYRLRPDTAPASLWWAMAGEKINLHFLTRVETDSGTTCSWCISATDMLRAKCLLDRSTPLGEQVEVIRPVAAVSIFPHRHHLAVPALAIGALGQKRIPIHALGTSLSSVVIVTSEHLISPATDVLTRLFSLPGNLPVLADSSVDQKEQ